MVSEAQKAATERWSKKNMTTIGCRVTKVKASLFKESCQKLGIVPNQVILKAVNDTIERAKEE